MVLERCPKNEPAFNCRVRPVTQLSFLDLVPVVEGATVIEALAHAGDLAAHVEALGFSRYWVAEHHGFTGVASAAAVVVIGHVAAATSTIRVGAGGIVLSDHAPLVVAEQFGTLDALYPNRIDLGLGGAPAGEGGVARALRRTLDSDPNEWSQDVMELQAYFTGHDRTGVVATPGAGARPQLWVFGSSLYGAQVAAALGLPYAFASHDTPIEVLDQALIVYRRDFRPSAHLDAPYAMAVLNVYAADTDAEAELIASSQEQSLVAFHTGHPRLLPPPVAGYRYGAGPQGTAILGHALQCSAVGNVATIAARMEAFIEITAVDEIMVTSTIFDHATRKRSLEITAAAAGRVFMRSAA